MKRYSMAALGLSAVALLSTAALSAGPALADDQRTEDATVKVKAHLMELNGSGVSGSASAKVGAHTIDRIDVRADGLTPNAPHAQHIHFGAAALHECPTLAMDANGDGRLTTMEGGPAYGPPVVALTETGDTTPANSAFALPRFPVADDGRLDYRREGIAFTDGGSTAQQTAEAVRAGQGVLVIHGIDYDGNGVYNFSDPEGASELNPALPAEATDPAACGVLR